MADNYESYSPQADKYLYSDGSVRTSSGEIVDPPDEGRAATYRARAPAAAKWMLEDGSVVEALPTSGGGGGDVSKAYVDQKIAAEAAARLAADEALQEEIEQFSPQVIDGGTF